MIEFGEEVCRDLQPALSREWLETNGLGGFASSTIIGLNNRRYHGLLIAATQPPVRRLVMLSKLEETLIVNGRRFELSANRYPGVVHPQGYRYLKRFRLDPFPVFTYSIEGVELDKSVFMIQGENSTVIQYDLRADGNSVCMLEVRPLIAFRDYHSTTHKNNDLNGRCEIEPSLVTVTPYQGLPPIHFAHTDCQFREIGSCYYNFEYDRERERGLDYWEDLFNPCVFVFELNAGLKAALIASTERRNATLAADLRKAETSRR
jgi:predicted glycogen debranching enzyme